MGVKERKEKDRQEMRQLILQSAHSLLLVENFENISIRSIAEAIEYSPGTIYLYFKDKNEIFQTIQSEAFKLLNSYVAEAHDVKDPFDQLSMLANKYTEFAFLFPKYYDIMFMIEYPITMDENSENWKEGLKAYDYLVNVVDKCKQGGYFKGIETKIITLTIWSYLHGVSSLALRHRMGIYPVDQREKIRSESLKQFLSLLKTS